jgi:hypothetical protein
MSELRVQLLADFKGDAAVLVSMDKAGVDAFLAALVKIEESRQSFARAEIEGATHVFAIAGREARVEPGKTTRWQISKAHLRELIEKLQTLSAATQPGHHYIDITEPAEKLVLSLDEHVGKDLGD